MSSNNNSSRFYHHFMPKTMPCIVIPSLTSPVLPSVSPTSSCDDHILNLSASLRKHCPMASNSVKVVTDECSVSQKAPDIKKDISLSPESPVSSTNCEKSDDDDEDSYNKSTEMNASLKVDMNCNDLKAKEVDGQCHIDGSRSECSSAISDHDHYEDEDDDESMTDIDVDDSCNAGDDVCRKSAMSRRTDISIKKSKSLAFGIDRILSFSAGDNDTDQKPPTSPSAASASSISPPVVSNTSSKSANVADTSKVYKVDKSKHPNSHHHQSHSILSKLKLCTATLPTSENHIRSASGLPYFHHSYGPFHHHHLNSIITSTGGGGIHNLNSHHHPPTQQQFHHHHNHQHSLSHCGECLFLRRYSGSGGGNGGSSGPSNSNNNSRNNINNIPSSSSSSTANNVATNNMQFSSSMATPCGPTSSAISASFTWMANPSIYDNTAIISPVAGYNQHVPLQPSFGMSSTGFSTLATMQQCSSGGSSGRRKRSWSRAVFSNLQRKGLEKRFQLQKYITKPDRRQLAATLGLTDAQVKVWFQNRRMKWRAGKTAGNSNEPPSSSVTSTTKIDGLKLALQSLNNSSPVVLVRRDDTRRKILHTAVTFACLAQIGLRQYYPSMYRIFNPAYTNSQMGHSSSSSRGSSPGQIVVTSYSRHNPNMLPRSSGFMSV